MQHFISHNNCKAWLTKYIQLSSSISVCVIYIERGRERGVDRQTDRRIDRQTDRQTDRHRQTDREREIIYKKKRKNCRLHNCIDILFFSKYFWYKPVNILWYFNNLSTAIVWYLLQGLCLAVAYYTWANYNYYAWANYDYYLSRETVYPQAVHNVNI